MIDGRSCFGFAYLGALDDIEEAGVNLFLHDRRHGRKGTHRHSRDGIGP
jgi:hypothetical protein